MSYQFFHLLLHTSKITKDTGFRELLSIGINPGQAWLLDVVARFGPIKQADAAAVLNVKLPAVSRMAKGMEQNSLLIRRRSRDDDRIVFLSLTPEGERLIPAIRESWSRVEEQMMQGFSERERTTLKKLLVRAAENLAVQ